jgi:hypothetical protein
MAKKAQLPTDAPPLPDAAAPADAPAAGEQTVHLLSSAGQLEEVPVSQAPAKVAAGYTQPSPTELSNLLEKARFETLPAMATSAASGLLSIPTLGLSDQAKKLLPAAAQDYIQKSEEHNPGSNILGQAAGFAIPVGPVAEAIKGAGAVGERVAGKILLKGTEEAPGLLAKTAVGAAKAVGESVPLAVQQTISESDLGDPSQLGENLVHNLGANALAFGALGGAGALGVGLVPKAINGARGAIAKLGESIENRLPVLQEALGIGGSAAENAETLAGYVERGGQEAAVPHPGLEPDRNAVVRGFTDSLTDVNDQVHSVKGNLFSELRPADREANLKDLDPAPARAEGLRIMQEGDKMAGMLANDPLAYDGAMIRDFDKHLQRFYDVARNPEASAARLNQAQDELRSALGDYGGPNFNDSFAVKKTKQFLNDFRVNVVKPGLENESVYGPAAAAHAELNNALHEQRVAEDRFLPDVATKREQAGRFSKQYEINQGKVTTLINAGTAAKNDGRLDRMSEWLTANRKLLDVADKIAQRNQLLDKQVTRDGLRDLLEEAQAKQAAAVQFPTEQAKYNARANAFKKAGGVLPEPGSEARGDGSTSPRIQSPEADALHQGEVRAAGGPDYSAKPNPDGSVTPPSPHGVGGFGNLATPAILFGTGHPLLAATVAGKDLLKSAVKSLGDVNATAAMYGYIKGIANKAGDALDKGLDKLLRPTEKAVGKIAAVGATAKRADDEKSSQIATYQKRLEEVQKLSNPQTLLAHTDSLTGNLGDHAPNVSSAFAGTLARVIQTLGLNIEQPTIPGAFAPKWKPNNLEAAKFNTVYDLVADPINTTLRHVSAGTLLPLHVAALQSAYPTTLKQLQSKLLEKTSALGPKGINKLPYGRRQSLALIMGMPFDGTMQPAFIRGAQSVYMRENGGHGVGPPTKGVGQVAGNALLKQSQQTATGQQRLAMRKY